MHGWYTAIVRKKPVPLPPVFAPFVRLAKHGDAVELVRLTTFLPGDKIRESLLEPVLQVQVGELERALGLPDPRIKEESLAAARLKLEEAKEAQMLAIEGAGCPFVFLDADAVRASAYELPLLLPMQQLQSSHPEWLCTETLTMEGACLRTRAADIVAVSHRWDTPEHP